MPKPKLYHQKVNVSLAPEVVKELDRLADELHTTRSGVITYCMQAVIAFTENKEMEDLIMGMVKNATKK